MNNPAGKPRRSRSSLRARPTVGTDVRRRLAMVAVVIFALLIGIGYRAYTMQVVNNDHYRSLADGQHLKSIEVPAPRGAIFDRRGVELAVTADADSVWANPRDVIDVAATARALAPVLDTPREVLQRRLSGKRYFVWLKRHLESDTAAEVRSLGLPGVQVTTEPRRFYPGKQLAGPVLGFADIDGRGLDGIELSMDEFLAGRRGQIRGVRDAKGKLMLPDAEATAEPGGSLMLTLDRTVQYLAESALERAVAEHKATAGVAIVLEVGTGDVLAMANVPTTNPNHPDPRLGSGRNRAIADAYEIGSVMKIFSVAAALEAGVVTPSTRFRVFGGRMRLPGGNVIHDSFKDDVLTVSGIIKRSSNVGAIQIARLLGRKRLRDALHRYRFGQRSGIELRGERRGILRPARKWGPTDLAVISYGYGMTATPLQATSALAAIGSGGEYFEPRIVASVRGADGSATFRRRPLGTKIMSKEVAAQMIAMMTTVFDKGRDGGTARSMTLDGFTAAGKTGTARKIDPSTGRYGKIYLSSFAGLAPAKNPRIAVLVLVDEPRSGHYYGTTVAGPAFAEIVTGTLKVLGVAPDAPLASTSDKGVADSAEPSAIQPPARVIEAAPIPARIAGPGDIEVPDFRGDTIRTALRRAASLGIELDVRGSGSAVSQSPLPGSAAAKGSVCVIEFRAHGESQVTAAHAADNAD